MYDLDQAHVYFQKGFFLEAEQLYRNFLIKNPASHQAASGIALAALQQNKIRDALHFMQRAVDIAPEIILYRRNWGELLRRVGQLDDSINILKVAIHMEPNNAENYFLLGLSYNDNHQFELAVQHYLAALSYNLKNGIIWNNLGVSHEKSNNKKLAKIAYATAIALNSKHAEAHNNLAALYSEEGRLDEARAHYVTAIGANPGFIEAHYNLSLIKTYTTNDPHLSLLESLKKNIHHESDYTRIRFYFALGKALDDTKQYSRAFKAYAEGNRLHHQHNPWDKEKLHELIAKTPEIFNSSFLKKPTISMDSRCPIFIVGMPRSGTTLIEQILSTHQNIFGAGELTILDDVIHEAYLGSDLSFTAWLKQLTDDDFVNLGKKYLEHAWVLAPDKHYIIDKMPGNCFYIGMIYRMFSNVKIIHATRDPMDSCFSCFTHLFKDNMAFAYDLKTLGMYYNLYATIMEHWQSTLPRRTIFTVSYEKMIENYESLSKELIHYLGLSWDPVCLHFYKNNRTVKTASFSQVRKPIYKTSVKRWRYFAKDLEPLRKVLNSINIQECK